MAEQKTGEVQSSYDSVADEYARHIYDELRHKPFDRQLLDTFAHRVKGAGLTCDIGCGPGQVARYLHDHGVTACGVDLSPGMVERARQLNPGIEFAQGNMLSLDVPDEAWAGITAFYAIVNLPPDALVPAMREMHRVLRSDGLLLLSFHIGDETVHEDNLWGCKVSLDFYFFRTELVTNCLRSAGFVIEEIMEREPYSPDVEYQSRRAYIFAHKPMTKTISA
ncbi:MAG TPA: methyltransferase domain-containing protein [Candidatus Sulfotelmatobacter sp.]|nr:methyltransferase domain-containing protein [Candidatus Sulfotelmatobacter sp.]